MTTYVLEDAKRLSLFCRNIGKGAGTMYMADAYHARSRVFPFHFYGKTLTHCISAATKEGWKVDKVTKTALCPACKNDHK